MHFNTPVQPRIWNFCSFPFRSMAYTWIKHIRSVCTRCVIERTEYLLPSPRHVTRLMLRLLAVLPPFSRKGSRIRVFAQVASRPTSDYVYSCTSTKYILSSSDVLRMIPNCWVIAVPTVVTRLRVAYSRVHNFCPVTRSCRNTFDIRLVISSINSISLFISFSNSALQS